MELRTPNYGYYQTGENQSSQVRQMTQTTDPAVFRTAVEKLRSYSLIAMVLAFLTIVLGAITLGVAAKNIGFPVFNFGPLLVGIIFFIGGAVGFNACRKAALTDSASERISYVKCGIVTVFAISVTTITLAILSAVFAFLSGAVCAGADITFYSRNNSIRKKLDVRQYCYPNDLANTVLAFVDGGLCILVTVWCIFGTIFFCYYGRHFGIKSRRRGF